MCCRQGVNARSVCRPSTNHGRLELEVLLHVSRLETDNEKAKTSEWRLESLPTALSNGCPIDCHV